MRNMMLLLCLALVSIGYAEEFQPLFELKLDAAVEGVLPNTGTGKVNAKICAPEKSHWGEGRNGKQALYLDNDIVNRKARGGGCITLPYEGRTKMSYKGPFSISFWFKPDAGLNNGGAYSLFSTFSGDNGRGIMLLYAWGSFRVHVGDGKKCQEFAVKQKVRLGAWNHVAVVHDNGKLVAYLNGIPGDELAVEMNEPSAYNLTIGSFIDGFAKNYKGAFSDFCIYNAALPPEQVQAMLQ